MTIFNLSEMQYCENCPLDKGNDLGPWNKNSEFFHQVKLIHKLHPGWKKGNQNKKLM